MSSNLSSEPDAKLENMFKIFFHGRTKNHAQVTLAI
jgi:hypothetical protein